MSICKITLFLSVISSVSSFSQKDRVELQRSFGSWKLRHSDDKRELFSSVFARKHYHKKVKGRVWGAWFGLIQSRWKQRVEKACQVSAHTCVDMVI